MADEHWFHPRKEREQYPDTLEGATARVLWPTDSLMSADDVPHRFGVLHLADKFTRLVFVDGETRIELTCPSAVECRREAVCVVCEARFPLAKTSRRATCSAGCLTKWRVSGYA